MLNGYVTRDMTSMFTMRDGSEFYMKVNVRQNTYVCGTCPIAALWLPCATNFSFVFSLVSPAGFVGSEQD